MKKTLSALIVSSVLIVSSAQASVSINFSLGQMFASSDTSTPFANGGLINILAKTDGLGWGDASNIFSNLTDSFVPTGAVLVTSFGNNNALGSGSVSTAFTYSYSGSFAAGNPLIAVGYSSLNTSSTQPGFGTSGFFYRSNTEVDGSISWVAPADGGTYDLYGLTPNQDGTLPANQFTSGALASGGSGFTTVPEPSTYALMALGGLVLFFIARRHKAQQA